MQFLAKYGKMYATKSDLNSRFEVFSQTYDKIKEHNSAPIERFQMGINSFADMTEEEFATHYGRKGVLKSTRRPQLKQAKNSTANTTIPAEVDWHKAGKMTTPSDQGGCGSCWAFTTAATMEAAYAIKHNTSPTRYSVQHLIDCDHVNQGCGGGWMLDAYEFTKK